MQSDTIKPVLGAVQAYIAKELKAKIGVFLDRAEEALLPAAGLESAPPLPQGTRAAGKWLAENRAELEAAMHRRMVESFADQGQRKNTQLEELKLLDDEALGVVMLRAHMVSEVMERARDLVVVLEARLKELQRQGAQVNTKSLTPGAIADGFIAVLSDLDVPQQVQAPLLEVYGKPGVDMLVEFYDGLNQLLIQHGILPDFKHCVVKQPDMARRTEAADYPSGPYGFNGAGTATGHPGSGGLPILDMKLTAMQQGLASLTFRNWQQGALRETFKLPPPMVLSPAQEESIDHIEAVFLDLMRDARISERFRAEMRRLILPLMALGLTEPGELSTADNPARRFIRQIALLGFRDFEFPVEDFGRIQAVVGRIVAERGLELASFISGSDALFTIARNEVQRQLAARQAQESTPEEEIQLAENSAAEEARRYVQAELKVLSAGLHLPPMLQQYVLQLMGPWMMVRFQRYGENSPQMKDSRKFAMMFFNLLAPARNELDGENKAALRRYALEQIEVRAGRSKLPEAEVRPLIEAVEQFFSELNDNPGAGIVRDMRDASGASVRYLNALPLTAAA